MYGRPKLNTDLDGKTFREYYYLKDELVDFCRENGLQMTGGKIELADRVAHFLDTGEKIRKAHAARKVCDFKEITLETKIEPNFVCSEKHRAFYKNQIGPGFSFNVMFQRWLKSNTGKTYRDSIVAYYQILEDKKKNGTTIDKQFEYNNYIRDFFADNKDKDLKQAIKCWKFKKRQQGSHKYEKGDLIALEQELE